MNELRLEIHEIRLSYFPYTIDSTGEGLSIPLKNAQQVYNSIQISEQLMSLGDSISIKNAIMDELHYSFQEFVDKIIEVNNERLQAKE